MAQKIGYQNGIKAFFDWYRKQPGVPQRGPGYDPNDINTWPWPDKMERTLNILKDDHDALVGGYKPPPVVTPPIPPDPLPAHRVAPMAYKLGTNDSDPRYCLFYPNGSLRPGITRIASDVYQDESGAQYNGDGLNTGGAWRDRNVNPPGLYPSNSMDARSTCDQYVGPTGVLIGGDAGYPEESYL